MLIRFVLFCWSLRYQFTKYFLIGVSAFLLDMSSLYLLREQAGLRQTVAVVINQPFIILYVFLLNKFWSFQATGMTHRQFVRFCLLSGWNYAFSALWMWVVSERAGVHYLVARTANVAVAVAWNFLLYKYWVYRSEQIMAAGVVIAERDGQ